MSLIGSSTQEYGRCNNSQLPSLNYPEGRHFNRQYYVPVTNEHSRPTTHDSYTP